jgi:cytochrome c-type biogenesis protein
MLETSGVGVLTAFVAGAISFLSPCVLPLVPGYVSYVAGRSAIDAGEGSAVDARALGLSLCFVLGFSTVFVLLGAGANALSGMLLSYRYEANLVGGSIVILFGLFTTGLVRLPWLERDVRWHATPLPSGNPAAAYLLGVAFAFGWTPCIGPVLGAILTMAATSDASGVALLAVYSLGLGAPFVLAALFLGGFVARLRAMRRLGRGLQVAAGGVMALMGPAMITSRLSELAFWLLATFPALGRIG